MAIVYPAITVSLLLPTLMFMSSVPATGQDSVVNPLERFTEADGFLAPPIEQTVPSDPSTVARLYLTVPETSQVLINGHRTRATHRDRYFEIPIALNGKKVPLTRVTVLGLNYHGTGNPEQEDTRVYNLYLLPGTTTYFTAEPEKKKQNYAMEFKTLTALIPQAAAPPVNQPADAAPTPQSQDIEPHQGAIKLRFRDNDDEKERYPISVGWAGGNPIMLFKHKFLHNADIDPKPTEVSLSFTLHRKSADNSKQAKIILLDERSVSNLEAIFEGDVVQIDVSKVLGQAVQQSLLLTHNAEEIIASNWELSFKTPGQHYTVKYDNLETRIKVLLNQD